MPSNEFYNATGVPSTGSKGLSASMRSEFAAIQAAFSKMPTMTGSESLPLFVNSGATAIEAKSLSAARSALSVYSQDDVDGMLAGIAWGVFGDGTTLSAGNGAIVDTSSASVGHSLPSSPDVGDRPIAYVDANDTFGDNNYTITIPTGFSLDGESGSKVITEDGAYGVIIYVGSGEFKTIFASQSVPLPTGVTITGGIDGFGAEKTDDEEVTFGAGRCRDATDSIWITAESQSVDISGLSLSSGDWCYFFACSDGAIRCDIEETGATNLSAYTKRLIKIWLVGASGILKDCTDYDDFLSLAGDTIDLGTCPPNTLTAVDFSALVPDNSIVEYYLVSLSSGNSPYSIQVDGTTLGGAMGSVVIARLHGASCDIYDHGAVGTLKLLGVKFRI